ncbi:uncharacterized protein LOC136027035 isoform X1 [Artemia franciscana]|uniref:uncharacterized protein LOC136027035 isoform X1 n=1 Tax=Artemia franciscana TaxID=6661 RepID=UPI0032DA890D
MFKDMSISGTLQDDIRCHTVNASLFLSGVDLPVKVLTTGYWLTTPGVKVNLPTVAVQAFEAYKRTSENFDNEEDTITIQLSDGDFTSSQPDVKFDETNFGSSSTSSSLIASTASNTYFFQNNLTTSNTFTVFEGNFTANFPHKKNHILTPDSESSTSNFPSALTTSKSNSIIIQPKNPFANTILHKVPQQPCNTLLHH